MGAGHSHSHDHAPADYSRAFALGIALNVAIVLLEAVFGILSGSMALIADAGHNLSDVLALLLAWGATILARRAPAGRRTYGMRKGNALYEPADSEAACLPLSRPCPAASTPIRRVPSCSMYG